MRDDDGTTRRIRGLGVQRKDARMCRRGQPYWVPDHKLCEDLIGVPGLSCSIGDDRLRGGRGAREHDEHGRDCG